MEKNCEMKCATDSADCSTIKERENVIEDSNVLCTCCKHKTKRRDEKEYKDLSNRLSRIEGQVRGVKRMLDEDYYCVDILTQVSAITAALKAFNCQLLESHINTCVSENIKNGNHEVVSELMSVLKKMMK